MKKIYNDSLELIGSTPILKVNNIFTGKCNLYLKLESYNLGGSIKDRPAKNMILAAEKKGLLKKGGTIVEATAGNTGIALAIIAIKRGYKIIIIVPDKMTVEKVYHLRALGAEVITARSDVINGHPEYYLEIAKKIANNELEESHLLVKKQDEKEEEEEEKEKKKEEEEKEEEKKKKKIIKKEKKKN